MQEPQYIEIDEEGNKFYFKDKEMTNSHRIEGPATEWADGGKEWYLNGKRHRLDGPAVEYVDGHKEWYVNDRRHREDGPGCCHSISRLKEFIDETNFLDALKAANIQAL